MTLWLFHFIRLSYHLTLYLTKRLSSALETQMVSFLFRHVRKKGLILLLLLQTDIKFLKENLHNILYFWSVGEALFLE